MQYWTPEGENIYLNKMEGRRLDGDSLEMALNEFFSASKATETVLREVRKIKEVSLGPEYNNPHVSIGHL